MYTESKVVVNLDKIRPVKFCITFGLLLMKRDLELRPEYVSIALCLL